MEKDVKIKQLLEKLMESGDVGAEIASRIEASLGDPEALDAIYKELQDFAGPEIEEPLQIEDYYSEKDGQRFQLLWPLSPNLPLPIPFSDLDRKTQFFVLFGEWQRRETEGMVALNNGQLEVAEATFRECLERAEQIGVMELRARSYEGLMRVAQKSNDRDAEIRFSHEAEKARGED
jgi:hypothetical protein